MIMNFLHKSIIPYFGNCGLSFLDNTIAKISLIIDPQLSNDVSSMKIARKCNLDIKKVSVKLTDICCDIDMVDEGELVRYYDNKITNDNSRNIPVEHEKVDNRIKQIAEYLRKFIHTVNNKSISDIKNCHIYGTKRSNYNNFYSYSNLGNALKLNDKSWIDKQLYIFRCNFDINISRYFIEQKKNIKFQKDMMSTILTLNNMYNIIQSNLIYLSYIKQLYCLDHYLLKEKFPNLFEDNFIENASFSDIPNEYRQNFAIRIPKMMDIWDATINDENKAEYIIYCSTKGKKYDIFFSCGK